MRILNLQVGWAFSIPSITIATAELNRSCSPRQVHLVALTPLADGKANLKTSGTPAAYPTPPSLTSRQPGLGDGGSGPPSPPPRGSPSVQHALSGRWLLCPPEPSPKLLLGPLENVGAAFSLAPSFHGRSSEGTSEPSSTRQPQGSHLGTISLIITSFSLFAFSFRFLCPGRGRSFWRREGAGVPASPARSEGLPCACPGCRVQAGGHGCCRHSAAGGNPPQNGLFVLPGGEKAKPTGNWLPRSSFLSQNSPPCWCWRLPHHTHSLLDRVMSLLGLARSGTRQGEKKPSGFFIWSRKSLGWL